MASELIPRSVSFHGDNLLTLVQDGINYVAVKPICDILGIDWESQRQRIMRDEVLGSCACVIQAQLPGDIQNRDVVFLPEEFLNGWLFGVSINRIRPENRERLILYKRECYRVLHAAFTAQQPRRPGQYTFDESGYSSHVGAFLTERCEAAPGLRSTARVLYTAYRSWCEAAQIHPLTQRSFGRQFTIMGVARYKSNGVWCYRGVGVKAPLLLN